MRLSTKTLARKPIEIFTDGSCVNYASAKVRAKKGFGGWAFIAVLSVGNVYRQGQLEPPQTNQTAEMYAVLRALEWVVESQLSKEAVLIVSDSLYVINGMVSQMRHQAAEYNFDIPNGEIWRQLHYYGERLPRVRYRHVRGHRGVKYNEMADRMASFARRGKANK